VRYLDKGQTPTAFEFQRQMAGENGNLEGCYLKGILPVFSILTHPVTLQRENRHGTLKARGELDQ
jgi:hypothetical protein